MSPCLLRGRTRSLLGLLVLLSTALALPAGASAAHDDSADHTDNMRVVGRDAFPYGTDLAFRGDLAVAGAGDWDGAYPTGVYLYDISGAQPRRLGFAACDGWHTDVDVWRNYVVQAHDSESSNKGCQPGEGEEGVRVIDIADPSAPRSIGFAETTHGSHNLTAVGDTGLVYISSYNLSDPSDVDGVSIVDLKASRVDPPVRFLEFPDFDNSDEHPDMKNESGDQPDSPGCHDIGLDLERDLAFCAAITETMIWDISNPRDPVIISIIRNPLVNIHHGARPNAGGDVLILDDEWIGAAGAGTGCAVPGAPTGALWFYDITDPKDPQPRSWWSPDEPEPQDDFCTSHFYDAFDDRDWVVTGWYEHGVYVVDFSDPSSPTEVAHYDPDGANFWSAYAERGHIYANSFAPATLTDHDEEQESQGGLWVFALDGYTPAPRTGGGAPQAEGPTGRCSSVGYRRYLHQHLRSHRLHLREDRIHIRRHKRHLRRHGEAETRRERSHLRRHRRHLRTSRAHYRRHRDHYRANQRRCR